MLKNFYSKIISSGNSLQAFLMLAIRLYWGYSFFQGGYGKLDNIDRTIRYLTTLDIPFPMVSAYVLGFTECVGGLCLLFGFAARLAAIPLSFAMVVALLTAHISAVKTMISDPNTFTEQLPFNFLLASLLVWAFGPGRFSIDALLKKIFFKK